MSVHPLTLALIALLTAAATLRGRADENDDRIRALEKSNANLRQDVEVLKKALPSGKEEKARQSNVLATISVGAKGLRIQSADTNLVLGIKGLLHVDARNYFDDGGINNNDSFLIRRARLILEAILFRNFDVRLQTDFGGSGAPTLRDAYLNYRYSDWFQIMFGKFKTPVGLEQLQSDSANMFIERSVVSDINPSRDVGVQVHGGVFGNAGDDHMLHYAFGIFNGIGDGRNSSNVDTDDEKSFAARVFVFPFQRTEIGAFRRLGFGVGGSYGRTEGAASLPNGNGYATEGQQPFFTYRTSATPGAPNVVGDGDHWRISPQMSWRYGPMSAIAEYVISSQELRRTDTGFLRAIKNSAWQVSVGYVLTGENSLERGVELRNPFDPREGHWGAVEFVARYSSLHIDSNAFPLFADPTQSASEARAWTLGLNWYLNNNIRMSGNFIHTDFRGGSFGPVTKQSEKAFFMRLQISF